MPRYYIYTTGAVDTTTAIGAVVVFMLLLGGCLVVFARDRRSR